MTTCISRSKFPFVITNTDNTGKKIIDITKSAHKVSRLFVTFDDKIDPSITR